VDSTRDSLGIDTTDTTTTTLNSIKADRNLSIRNSSSFRGIRNLLLNNANGNRCCKYFKQECLHMKHKC